jgi:hypothetical protein
MAYLFAYLEEPVLLEDEPNKAPGNSSWNSEDDLDVIEI